MLIVYVVQDMVLTANVHNKRFIASLLRSLAVRISQTDQSRKLSEFWMNIS